MTFQPRNAAPQPQSTGQHRFHVLDAMRGIAAVLVVLYHQPTSLHTIAPNSYLVVDLFFLLSGFVIGYSYEERLRTKMSLRTFTLARLIRFYPLYLLGTLLGLVDAALHAFHMHDASLRAQMPVFLLALFFLPNLFARTAASVLYPLDGPAWSLLFELIANLLFGLLVRCRLASSHVLLAGSLLSFAWIVGTHASMDAGWMFNTFWAALARVGYSFFLGVLLFRVYRKGVWPRLAGRTARVAMMALCAAVCLVAAIHVPLQHARVFGYLMATLVFPCLVLVGAACQLSLPWQPLCNFLGDLSYPLYILHAPPLYLIVLIAHFHHALLTQLFSLALLVVLIPAAWWLGKYFDLPVRRQLMARFLARTS